MKIWLRHNLSYVFQSLVVGRGSFWALSFELSDSICLNQLDVRAIPRDDSIRCQQQHRFCNGLRN